MSRPILPSRQAELGTDRAGLTSRARRLLVGLAAAGVLVALAIRFCPVPWSAVLFGAAAWLALLAWHARGEVARAVAINAAAICIAVAIFEAHLGARQLEGDGTRMDGTITQGFVHPDDRLGYAPDKGVRVTARKYYGDELLYDVAYTIDADGLRVAPPVTEGRTSGCVVFMGDSQTFGEGLNDDQTLPYQLGLKTAGRYAVYNFGFSGYGPHQMLANLQAGRVQRIVRCRPTHFFYMAILEHVARVAGLAAWDKHGPRYALAADGTPVRRGNFDDPPRLFGNARLPRGVVGAMDSFYTWQRFFGRLRDPTPADLDLFIAVVRESARLSQQLYPGSKFHMILWDARADPRLGVIEAELAKAGVPIVRVSQAIPDYGTDWPRYVLSAHDLHPNALQDERLADYLVREVLDRRQR